LPCGAVTPGKNTRNLLAGAARRERSRRNAVCAIEREKHRRCRKILERPQARTMFTVLIHLSKLKRRQTQHAAVERAKSESVVEPPRTRRQSLAVSEVPELVRIDRECPRAE